MGRGVNAEELLTPVQIDVARRVLAEESAGRDHVVVYLSGAHAYGFPSPDSDLDLKAIHVAPTRAMLGLAQPAPTHDRAEVIDGVEIDYTSNELGHALRGVVQGNGNFLERVLGSTVLVGSPLLESLRPIVGRALSRRVHRHYRGFATSQRQALEAQPTVKRLLYVLRTTLTGTHLLRTGHLVTDVNELLDDYGLAAAHALVHRKKAGERVPLEGSLLAAWRGEVDRMFAVLDHAESTSALPAEATNVAEIDAWLVEARLGSP
jgi:hypothetical protein